jgi:hypothetical protein
MTEEELKKLVDAIVLRTRNQDVVEYDDVDTLISYIDLLEYKLHRYEQATNDPEQTMIDDYYERLEQKEFDKWELRGYWNV